jgi:PadR family transcriptional regulator, regulatory protein PadR
MLRDFFPGFIKIHICHHAGQDPVYRPALVEEPRRHGYHHPADQEEGDTDP